MFLRGTDYIALRPSGHHVQPSTGDVINKTVEFLNKYHEIKFIYLVTEDIKIYTAFKEQFGEMLIVTEQNYVQERKDNWISESFNDDPYERGFNYLVKLVLLSKCDYIVSSITPGSEFAMDIRGTKPIDLYIFDLGLYE